MEILQKEMDTVQKDMTKVMGNNAQARGKVAGFQRAIRAIKPWKDVKAATVDAPRQGVPQRGILENRLRDRGIKRGSPEWNQVMQSAGYQ